jgi:hypothetical protein
VCAAAAAPNGVAVDDRGNVYVTESRAIAAYLYDVPLTTGEHVRVVDPAGTMHTFAGAGPYGSGGGGGPAVAAQLGAPYQLATTADGALLIGEVGLQRAVRVGPEGTLTALAGRPLLITIEGVGAFSGDGGRAVDARLYGVEGLGTDSVGNTFIADMRNSRIRLVDSRGSIITIAGTGASSDDAAGLDGTAGALANAGCPGALAVGPDDRVYYTDLRTSRVRTLTRVPY